MRTAKRSFGTRASTPSFNDTLGEKKLNAIPCNVVESKTSTLEETDCFQLLVLRRDNVKDYGLCPLGERPLRNLAALTIMGGVAGALAAAGPLMAVKKLSYHGRVVAVTSVIGAIAVAAFSYQTSKDACPPYLGLFAERLYRELEARVPDQHSRVIPISEMNSMILRDLAK